MMKPGNHRLLVVIWAIVETSLFGGIMHGWASLVYMVKEDGIYSYLCTQNVSQVILNNTNISTDDLNDIYKATSSWQDEHLEWWVRFSNTSSSGYSSRGYNDTISKKETQRRSVRCKDQDSMIALGQTISSSTSFIGILTFGQLHRKLGTKKLRILNWFFFVFGCLCVAFVTNDAPWLIFVAYWMVGVTGLGLLTTNIQVSYLYASASSTVVSLICGGYDFAGSVLLFIKLAYEVGVSLKISHIVLACGSVMTVISAICWLPWGMFTKQEEGMVEIKPLRAKSDHKSELDSKTDKKTTENLLQHPHSPTEQTLKTVLTSPLYMLHIMWYILLQIRFIYLVALLNPYLEHVTEGDTEKVSHFTNVFLYVNMFGYVTSFLAGIIYDWQKVRYKDSTPLRRSLFPAVLPLTLATVISLLVSVLILLPYLEVLYAVFILTTVYRSFFYSMAASFISQVFPSEHFSALYTVMVIAGGLVAFIQYALFSWSYAYEGAYTHVSIMLLCVVLLTFAHPVFIIFKCRRETPSTSTSTSTSSSGNNYELKESPSD